MAIKPSGQLSLQDVVQEFGGTQPYNLLDYYRGGARVPNAPANAAIPTSGQINLLQFYGAAAQAQITISTTQEVLNLYNLYVATQGTPTVAVNVRFINNATIGSRTTASAACYVGQFPAGSTIEFVNNGQILGAGGAGGGYYSAGSGGGGALYAAYSNQTVTINNYGTIAGGGGGGGSGGYGGAGGQGGPGYYNYAAVQGAAPAVTTTGSGGFPTPPLPPAGYYSADYACNAKYGAGDYCGAAGSPISVCTFWVGDSCIQEANSYPCNSCQVTATAYTNGGAGGANTVGGAGGVGQGYASSVAGGVAGQGALGGVAGGTNAGTGGNSAAGGVGGSGGYWGAAGGAGASGGTGQVGGSGNNGGGAGGGAGGGGAGGGAAGIALWRASGVTFNNYGTVYGALA